MPFKTHAPSIEATLEKLKYAVFYCALYLTTNYLWPLDVRLSLWGISFQYLYFLPYYDVLSVCAE